MQQKLFRRHFTSMLREADEKKGKGDHHVALREFTLGILGANKKGDAGLHEDIAFVLSSLATILSPETARKEDINAASEALRRSDMLKGFRVFESGIKLLDAAKQAGEKMEEFHQEVAVYREWLVKAKSLPLEAARNIGTASAFTQALGLQKASVQELKGIVSKARETELLRKCLAAETSDDFAAMRVTQQMVRVCSVFAVRNASCLRSGVLHVSGPGCFVTSVERCQGQCGFRACECKCASCGQVRIRVQRRCMLADDDDAPADASALWTKVQAPHWHVDGLCDSCVRAGARWPPGRGARDLDRAGDRIWGAARELLE